MDSRRSLLRLVGPRRFLRRLRARRPAGRRRAVVHRGRSLALSGLERRATPRRSLVSSLVFLSECLPVARPAEPPPLPPRPCPAPTPHRRAPCRPRRGSPLRWSPCGSRMSSFCALAASKSSLCARSRTFWELSNTAKRRMPSRRSASLNSTARRRSLLTTVRVERSESFSRVSCVSRAWARSSCAAAKEPVNRKQNTSSY